MCSRQNSLGKGGLNAKAGFCYPYNKLISKDALEAKLMLCMDMNRADWSYNKMIMANKMLEILDQEPIIEERKHGHWVRHNNIIACSECIWDMYWEEGNTELNYCPNCGAKINGVLWTLIEEGIIKEK